MPLINCQSLLLKAHHGTLILGDDLLKIESLLSLVVDCNVASVAKFRELFASISHVCLLLCHYSCSLVGDIDEP